ncbi:MAG: MgtC/SapB family protein [Cyclobacteriaceae bacterium]
MEKALSQLVTPYFLSLVVATGVGLIMGLEREFRKTTFAGIRTFPLVSILGCVITFISQSTSVWLLVAAIASFILLIGITFFVRSSAGHEGITTEVSLIAAFVLGSMTAIGLITEALAAAVIVTTLLSLKEKFHSFIAKLTTDELYAFIKFIIISMLVLPFLPDANYGPNGILNPRDVGWIIVIVSSLSFAAYLLTKFSGEDKGILYTSVLGGLVSSTAVTWMLSSQSRKGHDGVIYALGIIVSSAIMFLRVALLALIFNRQIFALLIWPCMLMSLAGFGYVFLMMRRRKPAETTTQAVLNNPVDLVNALGFGLLYVGIALLVYYAHAYFGKQGLYLSALISGLADVDAITISVSKLAGDLYTLHVGMVVIIIAMLSNTLVKLTVSLVKGAPGLRRSVLQGFGLIVTAGSLYIVFSSLVI